jgi:hypothetical protein
MDELTLKNESVDLIGYGNNFVSISDQEEYVLANEYLTQNKAKQKTIAEYFDPEIESANKTHKGLCAKKKALLEPLVENQKKVISACSDYLREQERKQKAEQARLEEEARKKAEAAQAAIIAAAEKEEKAGDSKCASDLMEQAADIEPEKVSAPEVVSKVKTQSGSSAWNDDLKIETVDAVKAYAAALRGEFPVEVFEISIKLKPLKDYFNSKNIKEYDANGLKVTSIKVPKLRV